MSVMSVWAQEYSPGVFSMYCPTEIKSKIWMVPVRLGGQFGVRAQLGVAWVFW